MTVIDKGGRPGRPRGLLAPSRPSGGAAAPAGSGAACWCGDCAGTDGRPTPGTLCSKVPIGYHALHGTGQCR